VYGTTLTNPPATSLAGDRARVTQLDASDHCLCPDMRDACMRAGVRPGVGPLLAKLSATRQGSKARASTGRPRGRVEIFADA
jgi:hypothetical protein